MLFVLLLLLMLVNKDNQYLRDGERNTGSAIEVAYYTQAPMTLNCRNLPLTPPLMIMSRF